MKSEGTYGQIGPPRGPGTSRGGWVTFFTFTVGALFILFVYHATERQALYSAVNLQLVDSQSQDRSHSLCGHNDALNSDHAALCNVLGIQYSTSKTQPSPVRSALEDLHYALETMQTTYFTLGLGTWPSSIDWTAAVFSTLMSASLGSLTRSLEFILPPPQTSPTVSAPSTSTVRGLQIENEINKYFSQSIAYYFGENAWEIRFEAYDDMLWVVLGWLENIRFIKMHASFHFPETAETEGTWYGEQFTPGFSHRARLFYDLAKRGWDTRLCGGGMVWNPRLTPYKNAITNQLFISASINMYLHFPGDDNTSPFMTGAALTIDSKDDAFPAHDRSYLRNAVDSYAWLRNSNMTNSLGLYVDGFHIHDYGRNHSIGSGKCDERNEMLYTYNQGVILSGLRGLWESTGQRFYLEDGHTLIRNVIAATGWDLSASKPPRNDDGWSRRWAGLGRGGVLEELCDISGRCSQDAQTFKGIFFHHFTLFCAPLPITPTVPGVSYSADKETASLHAQSCREYAAWVAHNAIAAMGTRDDKGRFGTWWGASQWRRADLAERAEDLLPAGAVDYRNLVRGMPGSTSRTIKSQWDGSSPVAHEEASDDPASLWGAVFNETMIATDGSDMATRDFNDRGRGRTVETQGGGLAVVRAMWEIVQMFRRGEDD